MAARNDARENRPSGRFQCRRCNQDFLTKLGLETHERRHKDCSPQSMDSSNRGAENRVAVQKETGREDSLGRFNVSGFLARSGWENEEEKENEEGADGMSKNYGRADPPHTMAARNEIQKVVNDKKIKKEIKTETRGDDDRLDLCNISISGFSEMSGGDDEEREDGTSETTSKNKGRVAADLQRSMEKGNRSSLLSHIELRQDKAVRMGHTSLAPPRSFDDGAWDGESAPSGSGIRCNASAHAIQMTTHPEASAHICKECGREFGTKRTLVQHGWIHLDLNDPARNWKCDDCDKVFSRKHTLKYHQQSSHDGVKFKCGICRKAFSSVSNLNLHKRQIHPVGGRKEQFECKDCGLRLATKGNLLRHMGVHSGEKRHKCDECGRPFRQLYDLGVHKRIHLGGITTTSRQAGAGVN